MKHVVVGAVIAASMAATSGTAKEKPIVITTEFDPSEIAWAAKPGSAVISGSALLRTVGGDVKTCAGTTVELIPKSNYATERMLYLFGSDDAGLNDKFRRTFASTPPAYVSTIIETTCDAQGSFVFDHLAAGTYYLTASVTWGVPMGHYMTSHEGGVILKRVTVEEGKTLRVVVTA